jgi:hypothetical protein
MHAMPIDPPVPDPSEPPLSSDELRKEAESKDRPTIHPGDAVGHTLPASEEGMSEPQDEEPNEASLAKLPPD